MVCIQVSLTQAQISVNLQQLTDASEQNKEENHKSFIFSPETNKKVKMILRSIIWWRHDVMIWWCNDLMIWWWVCDEAAVKHSNSTNMSTSECSGSACDWCQNPASELGLIRFDSVWLGLIRFDWVWLGLIGFDSASSSTDELLRPTPRHNLITDQCALTGSFSIPSRTARPVRPVKSYCILIICYPDQHRASTGPAPGQRLRIQRPNSP